MKPNEIIYQIRMDKKLSQIWEKLSRREKEEVLRRLKDQNECPDLESILIEIKTGQRWLF